MCKLHMNVNESTYIIILAYFLCKVKDLSSKLPCGVDTTIVLFKTVLVLFFCV